MDPRSCHARRLEHQLIVDEGLRPRRTKFANGVVAPTKGASSQVDPTRVLARNRWAGARSDHAKLKSSDHGRRAGDERVGTCVGPELAIVVLAPTGRAAIERQGTNPTVAHSHLRGGRCR